MARKRSRRKSKKSRSRSRRSRSRRSASLKRFVVKGGKLYIKAVMLRKSGKTDKVKKRASVRLVQVKFKVLKPGEKYKHPFLGELSQQHKMFKPFIEKNRGLFFYMKDKRLVPVKVSVKQMKFVKEYKKVGKPGKKGGVGKSRSRRGSREKSRKGSREKSRKGSRKKSRKSRRRSGKKSLSDQLLAKMAF